MFVLVAASALQHQGASHLGHVTASPHLVRHVAAELTRSLRAGERRDGIGGAAMTEDLVALALTRTAAHPSLDEMKAAITASVSSGCSSGPHVVVIAGGTAKITLSTLPLAIIAV